MTCIPQASMRWQVARMIHWKRSVLLKKQTLQILKENFIVSELKNSKQDEHSQLASFLSRDQLDKLRATTKIMLVMLGGKKSQIRLEKSVISGMQNDNMSKNYREKYTICP